MLTAHDKIIRRNRITGTRIGTIVGMNPFAAPIEAYEAIIEPPQPSDYVDDDAEEMSEDMARGVFLEEGMIKWYEHDAKTLVTKGRAAVHPDDNRFAATPDAIGESDMSEGGTYVLEVKCPRRGDEWGETGSRQIPKRHIPQVAWEMACTNSDYAIVVALVYGSKRVYRIPRNLRLEETLMRAADKFWKQCIERRCPPNPDSSEAYAEYISRKFKMEDKEILSADDNAGELLALLAHRRRLYDEALGNKREVENKIKKMIGGHWGIESNAYRATWSTVTPQPRIDWDGLIKELSPPEEVVSKHRVDGKPYRAFRLKEIA